MFVKESTADLVAFSCSCSILLLQTKQRPGAARNMISTIITRYRWGAKNLQYHIFTKYFVTAEAVAFAALREKILKYSLLLLHLPLSYPL